MGLKQAVRTRITALNVKCILFFQSHIVNFLCLIGFYAKNLIGFKSDSGYTRLVPVTSVSHRSSPLNSTDKSSLKSDKYKNIANLNAKFKVEISIM